MSNATGNVVALVGVFNAESLGNDVDDPCLGGEVRGSEIGVAILGNDRCDTDPNITSSSSSSSSTRLSISEAGTPFDAYNKNFILARTTHPCFA